MKKTASDVLLEQLAGEQRHVLSDWRGLILLRRSTFATPSSERRWEKLPQVTADLTPLFRQMRQREEIQFFEKAHSLYRITVPYARQGPIDEREVLFEYHPYAVLSHLSALAFHGFTGEQPKGLVVSVSLDGHAGLLPIGTEQADWEGIRRPVGRRPRTILRRPVEWVRTKPERFFGFADYRPLSLPMRYTTPERTLIDSLQNPDLAGGIETVFRAWVLARESIDLDVLTYDVERFGVAVLRQRIGYVLDQLDLSHPRLEHWRRGTHRGGSSRLVGADPFSSTFDQHWNLSLNAPVDVLHEWAI
jgi:hypothetical protein